MKDFCKSVCYMPPLKLEDGDQSTFLETSFAMRFALTHVHGTPQTTPRPPFRACPPPKRTITLFVNVIHSRDLAGQASAHGPAEAVVSAVGHRKWVFDGLLQV